MEKNMLPDGPKKLKWRKSSHSSSGNCVEVADTPDGHFYVRDSKNPAGPVLSFTIAARRAFIADVKAGMFKIIIQPLFRLRRTSL